MSTAYAMGAASGFARRFMGPLLLGWAGVLGLLAMPIPASIEESLATLPPLMRFVALVFNPALFVLVAAFVGAALAHRVQLGSWIAGTQRGRPDPQIWITASLSGLGLGVAFGFVDALLVQSLKLDALADLYAQQTSMGLLASACYGGLAEEVMLRWGLLSLLAWVLLTTICRGQPRAALGIAVVLASLIFAMGHLPILLAQTEPSAVLLLRTLLLNSLAGLLYGAWFVRRDLETAVLAHAATHPGIWLGFQLA